MYSSKPACDPNHDAALKLIVSGASSNSFCSTNLNNSKALVTDLLESARLRTPKAVDLGDPSADKGLCCGAP